ncbi:MAG: glycosyltransferase family 2 protein [Bacteroidales bacterium]|jgi:glycosyltransferase involved in cell wall biosynthesis|nr:glycosyltransferase family 2 protein [Bacteroidales bacterium]MCK9499072.1 glycosyltransferase family 2 protein [Bacteroidales bacterium]MDY0315118.1 glycosyltransferase family 2 protein [Bacteroidales bacterium]
MEKSVSIIVPCYNEEKYIENCLNSILDFDYPLDKLEVFFIDGMSNDLTREIILKYSKQHSFIKLIDNPKKTVPFALNKAIKLAKGEIIIRLDAHASYSKNYIKYLVENLQKLNAANVGVVWKTDVYNKNKKSLAIKKVLSHPIGVGNAHFRTGVTQTMEVDTVPFGCWRKESFEKHGFFNEKLTRNQDIEFNKRIINAGEKIYLLPNAECVYYARETFRKISKNNFQNGMWNILTVFYTKDLTSLSLRHFVPLFFVLSLFLPLLFALIYWPICIISVFSFILYLLLIISISIKLNDKTTSFFNLVYTFFILHISYGIGSLTGILKLPFIAIKKD